jgi:hypothetical protein
MDPVRVPFSVGPDLVRSTAPLSSLPSEQLREHKLTEFNGPLGADLIGSTANAAYGIQLLATHLGQPGASLKELALSCAEDIALLHRGVLKAIAFAFPSGFRPTTNLGLDFAAIHGPVADGDALRAASAGISAAMSRPGACFERSVWTLTSLNRLSQHPSYTRPPVDHMNKVYFRTEFQVIQSLSEAWAGFGVRVSMTPWTELTEEYRVRITASLATMSPATRSYKGLDGIAQILGV